MSVPCPSLCFSLCAHLKVIIVCTVFHYKHLLCIPPLCVCTSAHFIPPFIRHYLSLSHPSVHVEVELKDYQKRSQVQPFLWTGGRCFTLHVLLPLPESKSPPDQDSIRSEGCESFDFQMCLYFCLPNLPISPKRVHIYMQLKSQIY